MRILAASLLLIMSICFGVKAQNSASPDLKQISVAVGGEVNKRGFYKLPEGTTLIDALEAAGGLSVYATDRIYFVSGDKISIISVKKLRKQGSKGPMLKDGDHITSPFNCGW